MSWDMGKPNLKSHLSLKLENFFQVCVEVDIVMEEWSEMQNGWL